MALDPHLVKAVGHGPGTERLLLQGPLQYGCVASIISALAFCTPTGVIALGVLCFGDATAALIGKRYGRFRLPWNASKVCARIKSYNMHEI
jgi:dolichol kinase